MEQYMQTADNVVHLVLPTLLTVLTPVVVVIVRAAVKKYTEKLDAETKVAVQHMVDNVVGQGVAYAEQYAKTQEKAIRGKVDGSHKMEMATQYVLEHLHKNGLPDLASNDIQRRVESYLGLGTLNENFMKKEGGEDEEMPVE